MSNEENTMQEKSLTVQQAPELPQRDLDVGAMIQSVIDRGITEQSVAAVTSLVDLYERIHARTAAAAFAADFSAMQASMPPVVARREVKRSNGQLMYRYASYEDIMQQVGPHLTANGFAVKLDYENTDNSVTAILSLIHRDGHREVSRFRVRSAGGPANCTAAQCDEAAATLAKRCAIAAALNIATDKSGQNYDNDARLEGDTSLITFEQASDIERRIAKTGRSREKLLKFCGVTEICDIPARMWPEIDAQLKRAEAQ